MTRSAQKSAAALREDSWVWGKEKIIWGYDPSHQYTFKILEPFPGRAGCLSLQYHQHKSESWLSLRGVAWILVICDGIVCTRIMRTGDVQNMPAGTIHRLTAVSIDAQIAEPSTPDAHAADKTIAKDVVRLHCYHGRPVSAARSEAERKIIEQAVRLSDEAMNAIDKGEIPAEHNLEILLAHGAFSVR